MLSSQLKGPLRGNTEQNLPFLWKMSEKYLDRGGRGYKIVKINNKTITLENNRRKENWVITLLKIVSYLTMLLPIIAHTIRHTYRKQYSYQVIDRNGPMPNRPNIPQTPQNETINALEKMRQNINNDLDLLSKGPQRVWDKKAYEFTDFFQGMIDIGQVERDVINLSYSLPKNDNVNRFKPKGDELIVQFCEVYRKWKFIPYPVNSQSGVAKMIQLQNQGVEKFSESLDKLKHSIVSQVLSVVYPDKNEPPQAFLNVALGDQAMQELKEAWELHFKQKKIDDDTSIKNDEKTLKDIDESFNTIINENNTKAGRCQVNLRRFNNLVHADLKDVHLLSPRALDLVKTIDEKAKQLAEFLCVHYPDVNNPPEYFLKQPLSKGVNLVKNEWEKALKAKVAV